MHQETSFDSKTILCPLDYNNMEETVYCFSHYRVYAPHSQPQQPHPILPSEIIAIRYTRCTTDFNDWKAKWVTIDLLLAGAGA